MKTILVITTEHPYNDGRIYKKEINSLKNKYNVILLCNKYVLQNKKIIQDSNDLVNHEGIKIGCFHGLFFYSSNQFINKVQNRVLTFLNLKDLFFFRNIIRKVKVLNINPDIIHIHEHELLKTVKHFKKSNMSKTIYDVHEMIFGYPFDKQNKTSLWKIWKSVQLVKKVKKYSKYLDITFSVNKYIRSAFEVISQRPKNLLLENSSIFTPPNIKTEESKIVLVHEGSLKFNRGLKLMVELFSDSWFRDHVKIKIIGGMDKQESNYFDTQVLKKPYLNDCFEMIGWVDYESVPDYLSGSSIGVIFMEPKVNNLLAGPPNKLYNYMACHLPILSFDLPASTDYIQEYEIGEVVDRNVDSVKMGVKRIIKNYDSYQKNVEIYRDRFMWKIQEERLLFQYSKLISED